MKINSARGYLPTPEETAERRHAELCQRLDKTLEVLMAGAETEEQAAERELGAYLLSGSGAFLSGLPCQVPNGDWVCLLGLTYPDRLFSGEGPTRATAIRAALTKAKESE